MNENIPKWLLPTLGGLLSVFLLLLVIDKVYSLTQTFENKNPKNTISVSAEGKIAATPDTATVSVGVISQGATPQSVQDESTKKINKIIETVKKDGVPKEDIVTSQFNIYPQHDYKDGKDTISGYQANQTITIKVKGVDKSQDTLSKILVDATDNGGNQIYGVSFGFDNPDDIRQQARKMAIENAKVKAQDLAKVAGLTLGKVVSISESGGGVPMPVPYAAGMGGGANMALDKVAPPTIEPGSQDIVQDMTVTFEIK